MVFMSILEKAYNFIEDNLPDDYQYNICDNIFTHIPNLIKQINFYYKSEIMGMTDLTPFISKVIIFMYNIKDNFSLDPNFKKLYDIIHEKDAKNYIVYCEQSTMINLISGLNTFCQYYINFKYMKLEENIQAMLEIEASLNHLTLMHNEYDIMRSLQMELYLDNITLEE
jgi:hypothetical protein